MKEEGSAKPEKQEQLRDLYNEMVSYREELLALRVKVKTINTMSDKYGKKFQVRLSMVNELGIPKGNIRIQCLKPENIRGTGKD